MAPPPTKPSSANISPLGRPGFSGPDSVFRDHRQDFDDVFGGPPKYSSSIGPDAAHPINFDSIFGGAKPSNLPVYDRPIYDDDVLEGLDGLKSSADRYDDVFSPNSGSVRDGNGEFDDLLRTLSGKISKFKPDLAAFDDFRTGFGGGGPTADSRTSEATWPLNPTVSATESISKMEDPFAILESTFNPAVSSPGVFPDPLAGISSSGSKKFGGSSAANGGIFGDLDLLNGLRKSVPASSSEMNKMGKDMNHLRTGPSIGVTVTSSKLQNEKSFVKSPEEHIRRKMVNNYRESGENLFDMPKVSTNSKRDVSLRPGENLDFSDDAWLTVSEIRLRTQPIGAPPPSRPPPQRPPWVSKPEISSLDSKNPREKVNEFYFFHDSSPHFQSSKSVPASVGSSHVFRNDEFEGFTMGRTQSNIEPTDVLSREEMKTNSSAAASASMKEAMDRAEAKLRHIKRERENAKAARSQETVWLEKDENPLEDAQGRILREKQERLGREQRQREKEEQEREQQRLEEQWERTREMERERKEEREREKAKQAVERAKREAQERVEKAVVRRAQAEARERAATEARERAEKAAAEARERASVQAKEKETWERAAAERAGFSASGNQQKTEDDLESFFSKGARSTSAPRPRAGSSDTLFEVHHQNRPWPEGASSISFASSFSMRKASSTTNIVDDITSIFGVSPSSGEFQEVEGESEERQKARLELQKRIQERAAKALAEKNQRDLQTQREQEERHRIADTLDLEIRRWAAGKEGNLRALLSTLQYVVWAECGWEPVSLTDLITASSVKKAYRKATLCIHPDKVQQKGASLQQKYIAEKVFDLLKEAWNKFNSNELI